MSTAQELMQSPLARELVGNLQHRLVRQFGVQAADWLDTCRELANWEDLHLIESPSPQRFAEHAAMLDELERFGRWLESAASEFGAEAATLSEQIQLSLQDLHDSRAMWHGNVSPARKKEILRDCFNEP